MFVQDYILNGAGYGPVGEVLANARTGMSFDPGMLRPYFSEDDGGRPSVTLKTGRMVYNAETKRKEPEYDRVRINDLKASGVHIPVHNATSLRKEEWDMLDKKVHLAARFHAAALL